MLNLIFNSSTGLGLNILRYHIPASINHTLSPNISVLPERAMSGFRPYPDQPYNWSADPYQRDILLRARERGADIIEATSESPPWWMTESGDVAGNIDGSPNLAPKNYGKYAEYLADVIKYFAETWNVTFSAVSPLNEPLDTWWRKGNIQEGCGFPEEGIVPFFRAMRKALDERGLGDVVLAGLDEWVVRSFNFFTKVVVTARDMELFQRINVHSYRSPTFLSLQNSSRFIRWISLREVRMGLRSC